MEASAAPIEPHERLIASRYQIEKLIGRGGMADVYRAQDLTLNRAVALKLLRAQDPRNILEIQALARVNHPNLVTLYDAGTEEDDLQYLVMELIDGPSLSEAKLPLTLEEVHDIGLGISSALAHLHSRGLVHRDVKPGNILLSPDRPRLADLGVARILDTPGVTETGVTIGTAAYLSPEQVEGQGVTPPSDIYALGLVLFEALTGTRPYTGTQVEMALARLTRSPLIPMSLPPFWRDLLTAMTSRNPAERPTAERVVELLSQPFEQTTAMTTPVSTSEVVDADATTILPVPLPVSEPNLVLEDPEESRALHRSLFWGLTILILFLAGAALFFFLGSDPGPGPTLPQPIESHVQQLEEAVR